jgi:multimeric flavodoxin WrbA
MKVLAITGSPRKKKNTGILLEHALAGAKCSGADVELVHLYEQDYRGCRSCFACKRINGKDYGRCAVQDGLAPILQKVSQTDVLILGSPIYFNSETGEMRSLMERLLFPYLTYTEGYASIFPRKIRTALFYTMNIAEQDMTAYQQDKTVAVSQAFMEKVFGNCEVLLSTDTYQFNDYSQYVSSVWDAEAKQKRHEEIFPLDCKKAYEMGARLCARSRDLQKEGLLSLTHCA